MADQEISLEELRRWLLLYAQLIAERENQLTELDAAIGDADHGINMHRGTTQIRRVLTESRDLADMATFLRMIAFTLINSIGGAAGPLYGSFFLNAASVANRLSGQAASPTASVGKPGIATTSPEITSPVQTASLTQIAEMFVSGLNGVKQRGKASLGEKTMIDSLEPAVQAMQDAIQDNLDVSTTFDRAKEAAHEGMQKTIELVATKGRASYLGERSRGHQDPGATSTYYLFEAAAKIWGSRG